MAIETLKTLIADVPLSKGAARKRELTPEQLAQEPVYMRFTKAEMETLEEAFWDEGILPKGMHLQPRVLTDQVKAILQKFGVDWTKTRKTLARPTVIRR